MTKFISILVAIMFYFSCSDDKQIDAGVNEIFDAGYDAGQDTEIIVKKMPKENEMAKEIEWAWTIMFDEVGASKDDWRRENFTYWAGLVAKYIILFQNLKSNIEYKLPNDNFTHLLIAKMIYQESSVNPNVIGRSHGEVGLMQIHGKALCGYKKTEVKENSELGIFLGIRWLARAIAVCPLSDLNNWNLSSWLGPLAVYGGGEYRAKINGKCKRNWGFAKRRIQYTKILAERLALEKNI